MTSTCALILRAATGALKTQIQPSAASIAVSAGLGVAGVLLGVMALGALAFATYMGLHESLLLSPQRAATWVALGIALVAAVCIASAVHCLKDTLHRKQADTQALMDNLSDEAIEKAIKLLEEPVAANPMTSVAVAAMAGFMAGRKL